MKKMVKKLSSIVVVASMLAVGMVGCTTDQAPASKGDQTGAGKDEKYTIATVVKISGTAWFDRMGVGVEEFKKDTGHEAFQVGPQQADAAQQVQVIEDLIAQQVDAICVVPFSVEAVEPVLKKARDQGIVVITHEASSIQNADYDIEPFDNVAYGRRFMEQAGEITGGEGEYGILVGSLTSKSHNEWADGAMAVQKEQFPNMKIVAERVETYDDQTNAYERTKEIIKANPNIKAIIGSAMTDVPGAALAIEEMGLEDQIAVVGTSLVSTAGKFLETGAADSISFWDPAEAGYAMSELAVKLLDGEEVGSGLSLEATGYQDMSLDGKVFYGSAWLDANKETMGQFSF